MGNESKISFETLVFHNVNFSSNDRSFDVAVIIFSDGPWRLGIQIVQFVKQVRKKQNFQPPASVMKRKPEIFFLRFHVGKNLSFQMDQAF